MRWIQKIKFNKHGLIPAVIQDYKNKDLLMVAYMNREALERTVKTKKTHFYSRSRDRLWFKGEDSGHIQKVKAIFVDCDKDSLLIQVEQVKAACHHGYRSCFYRRLKGGRLSISAKRVFDPKKVY